jgi:hypothetical protein
MNGLRGRVAAAFVLWDWAGEELARAEGQLANSAAFERHLARALDLMEQGLARLASGRIVRRRTERAAHVLTLVSKSPAQGTAGAALPETAGAAPAAGAPSPPPPATSR